MTYILLFTFVLAFVAMAAMYVSIRGHHRGLAQIEDIEANTSPVNLKCFARITDASDQKFLRASLPRDVYRKVQRERIRIAIQYVRLAARNASVLICIGEMQASNGSDDVQRRAKTLVNECVQLRLICLVAILMLCISFLIPEQSISIEDLTSTYERMSDSLCLLSMQSDPLLASRARSWL